MKWHNALNRGKRGVKDVLRVYEPCYRTQIRDCHLISNRKCFILFLCSRQSRGGKKRIWIL